jgi:hypothetical protein
MSTEWLRGWPRGKKEMMYVCHFLVLAAAVFFVNKILTIVISIVRHHDFPLSFQRFLVIALPPTSLVQSANFTLVFLFYIQL